MKQDEALSNGVRVSRLRLGLSQQQLAEAAGIARQTVSGIEGGLYAASATVALRLARALGCTVEELFWLEDDRPTIEAVPCREQPAGGGSPITTARAVVARVQGRWIAHGLVGDRAFRTEVVPADGLVMRTSGSVWDIRLLDDRDTVAKTVLVAGCAPALSLWARSAERWRPGLRVHWIHANSSEALEMLRRGEVHAAGLHLHDDSGDDNTGIVRAMLPATRVSLINLGVWQEGILVARSNPKAIRGAADLARSDVRIVNRELGAGSRSLLESALAHEGITPSVVRGWENIARSHEDVARTVAAGTADAGVSAESLAGLFGLDFAPLRSVRYDIAVLDDPSAEANIREFSATLAHRWVRTQLRVLGGFDTSKTGETVAVQRST
jgi:molybdate-binding protein/DNA-binding XRE family transcriptional regulator